MKRWLLTGLFVVAFVLSAAVAVKAACPAGCKKSCCAAKAENQKGCEKADPNSK